MEGVYARLIRQAIDVQHAQSEGLQENSRWSKRSVNHRIKMEEIS